MSAYREVADKYYNAGWAPLPLPAGKKTSPPDGLTGQNGRWPTVDEVQLWTRTHAEGNIGLRVPDTVIGIDVDDYDGKGGGDTLAKLIDELGELPPTWVSTSRGLGVSGIRVYRIPAGVQFPGILGPGIDVIQHHHRYIVAAPSVHPDTSDRYKWYKPDGSRPGVPPIVGELPDLPSAWLERFRIKPTPAPEYVSPPRLALAETDDSIAERINRDHNWHDVLSADGWTLTETKSAETRWARPGKNRGTSGVLHEPDGPFNVFTTEKNLACLQQTWAANANETCWAHSMFGYLAATRHNGDRSACAREYRLLTNEAERGAYVRLHAPTVIAALDAVPEVAAEPNDPWPDVIPLGETTAVARFPTEVLPQWMQPIVVAIADDLQAEPDLPGVLGIIALSTACAGKRHVIIRDTWHEPLNVYAVIALPPSSGKSPAFKWMIGPIRAYENEKAEETAGQVEHVAQTRRMVEKAMKRAEDKGDAQEARIQLDKLLTTPELHPFRLLVDDVTPEALVQRLYEHNERLALLSTEGGPFGMMGGRYSDTANLDPYLKPWSNDPIDVDRVGRGAFKLNKPVLTIGLTVQPTVIASLAENPEMIGKGLTARFMYSVPRVNTGYRDMFYDAAIPEEARTAYARRLTALLESEVDAVNPPNITIEPDAVHEFHGWRQGLEVQRGPAGALHIVSEWTTKLESTVARVAGLLALADLTEHVDVPTMRRAICLGNYWLSHIRAVLDLWGRDDTVAKARQVAAWMSDRELTEFSVRDLYGSLRRLFPTADECRPVLNLLTERGWIRPMFDGPLVLGRRGVDSPRYAVRPLSLWTNPPHARHARHVPKGDLEQISLTHSECEGSTPLAHGTHDAHEQSTPMDDADTAQPPTVVDDPWAF